MHGPMGKSFYTKSVSSVVDAIQNTSSLKDSLFEQAEAYFQTADEEKASIESLKDKVSSLAVSIENDKSSTDEAQLKELKAAKAEYSAAQAAQTEARLSRLNKALDVCAKILLLCEADTWEKTQVNSAKFLGTLQLLSPCEGKNLRHLHKKLKPPYKAVIALRLLDKLLFDGEFNNTYVTKYFNKDNRYSETEDELSGFQSNIAVPVVLASLFQDIGLLHPKAQLVLKGRDGDLDEFRVLTKEERTTLLRINYEQTIDYLSFGLGKEQYIGNSKHEREQFNSVQQERLMLTRTLITEALKPKQGIGNLVKIPQIYTSIIFSSKHNYNFMDLPKAALVVKNAAENSIVSKMVAGKLLNIVGYFPQGFGITYIPQDEGNKIDRYEYAIVTQLNPEDPYQPTCRTATRNLTFISNGTVLSISKQNNLYFKVAKKRLEVIPPERLGEILRKLVSNFEERKALDLIPSYWNPYEFFGYEKLQNLWKKS